MNFKILRQFEGVIHLGKPAPHCFLRASGNIIGIDEGIINIESIDVLNVKPFTDFGSVVEIVKGVFGGKENYTQAVRELEKELYKVA